MQPALKVRIAALVVSVATWIGLVVTLTTVTGQHRTPPTDSTSSLSDTVTLDGALGHLASLQQIADAHDGRRMAGTTGFEASAQYVEQVLAEAGYRTERQSFTIDVDLASEAMLSRISAEPVMIGHSPMRSAPATPEGGVQGEVLVPVDTSGCTASSYPGGATGKIVLAARGVCSFTQKSAVAAEAGAVALVVYNDQSGSLRGSLEADGSALVPTTGITKADGESLLADLGAGPLVLRYDVQYGSVQREAFNVLAQRTGGGPGDVVMVGAHLDSAPGSPGINDNGSGVAAMLEIAVRLAELPDPKSTVRFAFWGAEESGLLGSTHYVADLVSNDPAALAAIELYLNLDMLASPNYQIGVYDGPAAGVLTEYFDTIGQPWVGVDVEGGSDHAPFAAEDVPITGLYTGSMELKDADQVAMFGGTAGAPYDPGYHTPQDDLANIDSVPLEVNLKAAAHVVEVLAAT